MRNGYIQIYFWGTSSPENLYPGYEFSGELVPFRLGYEFSRVRVLQGTSSPDTSLCDSTKFTRSKISIRTNFHSEGMSSDTTIIGMTKKLIWLQCQNRTGF